jgi:hypothetical protein
MSSIPSPQPMSNFMYPSPNSIAFFWQPPSDLIPLPAPITNYKLSIPSILYITVDSTTLSYQANNLPSDVVFDAIIQCSCDDGVTWSDPAPFPPCSSVTTPTQPPTSPLAEAVSPGVALISWSAPTSLPDGKGFYLVNSISSNPSDPGVGFGSIDLSVVSCTLEELNPLSTYSFTISVANQVGISPLATTNSISFS